MNAVNLAQTFLEGVLSFVSPCMLPLLPLYAAYFATGNVGKARVLARAAAFIAGFTAVFVALGVSAGSLGAALAAHRAAVSTACGALVVVFGLGYLGVLRLPFSGMNARRAPTSVLGAFVFGLIYSVSLTPCVGAFLGAALMLAASEGGAARGAALLFAYSLGLGLPFAISAVLLDRFGNAFGYIKNRYNVITPVCGALLIAFGLWMSAAPWLKASEVAASPSQASSASALEEISDNRGIEGIEVEVTSANFEAEVLKGDKPVLVDFWAPWCGPCRMLGPIVTEIAQENAGRIKVCKVNVDNSPELASQYGISGIPTLILFKKGRVAAIRVGLQSKADLQDFISQ